MKRAAKKHAKGQGMCRTRRKLEGRGGEWHRSQELCQDGLTGRAEPPDLGLHTAAKPELTAEALQSPLAVKQENAGIKHELHKWLRKLLQILVRRMGHNRRF